MIEHITQEFLDMIRLPNPDGKRLNYLFIMPKYTSRNDTIYTFPIGFGLVCASIKASGRNVTTLNLNYKENYLDLIKKTIQKNNIDVVAIGGLSSQYKEIKEILDISKDIDPHIVTLVGGGIITTDPETAIIALDSADYGLIGEGELTINDVAYALENDEPVYLLPNVVTREHGANPIRPEIKNLDVLPFPDYDGLEYHLLLRNNLYGDMDIKPKSAGIATGRACPCHCTFCFHTSGQSYRRRSIENVKEELEMLFRKYDIRHIYVIDELFVTETQYTIDMINMISQFHVPYRVTARVDMISESTLQLLHDTGCYQVSFGVESADNRILKSMKKHITVEQIDHAFTMAEQIGINAQGHIIFGDLEEDEDSIQTSVSWWQKHRNWNIRLWWILTFPGSELYHVAVQRGLITDTVSYLKEGKFQINISQLSDAAYWSYVSKIELLQSLDADSCVVDLTTIPYYQSMIKNNLSLLHKNKTVAVWPATVDNLSMLNNLSPEFTSSKNTYFVNIRPWYPFNYGMDIGGKKIVSPDKLFQSYHIDVVLYAYGYRYSDHIYESVCSMAHDYNPQIKILRMSDLLNSNKECT